MLRMTSWRLLRYVDPSVIGAESKYRYLKEQPRCSHPMLPVDPNTTRQNAQSSLMLIPNISTEALTSTNLSTECVHAGDREVADILVSFL